MKKITTTSSMYTIRKIIYLMLSGIDLVLKRKNPVTVFSYHSFARDGWKFSVDPEMFAMQLSYLAKSYQFISVTDLKSYLSGKKTFVKPAALICIDDGYADVLEVKEILEKRKITPLLFVLANTAKPNRKELGNNNHFLTVGALQLLIHEGWTIGCHSNTHANLVTLEDQELGNETIEAKKKLEKELNTEIPYFAYPRGKYNTKVLQYLARAKYTLAFTMDDDKITPATNSLRIPRVGVDRSHSLVEFKTLMSPSVIFLRKLMKKLIGGLL